MRLNEERRRPLIACQFSTCHTSQIRDNWNERSSRGSRKHTSPAICRAGRVPLREAFRGSVITCSRNNERLILSSWLATPSLSLSPFSLPLPLKTPGPSRLIDLSLYRFLSRSASTSPLIVRPFVPYSRALLFYTFLFVVSPNIRSRFEDGDIDSFRMRFRVRFNRGREIWICEANRWGVGSRFIEVLYLKMPSVLSMAG